MDVVDVTGTHVVDIDGQLFKHETDANGALMHSKDIVRSDT